MYCNILKYTVIYCNTVYCNIVSLIVVTLSLFVFFESYNIYIIIYNYIYIRCVCFCIYIYIQQICIYYVYIYTHRFTYIYTHICLFISILYILYIYICGQISHSELQTHYIQNMYGTAGTACTSCIYDIMCTSYHVLYLHVTWFVWKGYPQIRRFIIIFPIKIAILKLIPHFQTQPYRYRL